ncbi:hypothetical protein Pen01_04770 [Phytomonospora endophytica]|nr:hypothetical protein Pen01_04770 [Phytomonospora endophytica]
MHGEFVAVAFGEGVDFDHVFDAMAACAPAPTVPGLVMAGAAYAHGRTDSPESATPAAIPPD